MLETYFLYFCWGLLRSHLMTTGLSGPDAALVHGFRGSSAEEDTGDAVNPEKQKQKYSKMSSWHSTLWPVVLTWLDGPNWHTHVRLHQCWYTNPKLPLRALLSSCVITLCLFIQLAEHYSRVVNISLLDYWWKMYFMKLHHFALASIFMPPGGFSRWWCQSHRRSIVSSEMPASS